MSDGWLLARDGMIAEVGSGAPPSADEELSLEGCVAILQSSRERREVMLSYQSTSPIQVPAETASK